MQNIALKLNIGCGKRRILGYVGVDAVHGQNVDKVALATELPYQDNSVDEILAVHVWEHFSLDQCETVISEWWRVLKHKGTLTLELPCIRKCCENFLKGKPESLGLRGIYGDPDTHSTIFDIHKWGWTHKSLSEWLTQRGFFIEPEVNTVYHPIGREIRDFRIDAIANKTFCRV